jgi:Mg2+ and Co2+ transporter CorA
LINRTNEEQEGKERYNHCQHFVGAVSPQIPTKTMLKAFTDFKANESRSSRQDRSDLQRDPIQMKKLTGHPGWAERKLAINARLKDLLVFELTMTGARTFKSMTPRGLYNHVLAALATRPAAGLHASSRVSLDQSRTRIPISVRARLGSVDLLDTTRTAVAPIDEGNEEDAVLHGVDDSLEVNPLVSGVEGCCYSRGGSTVSSYAEPHEGRLGQEEQADVVPGPHQRPSSTSKKSRKAGFKTTAQPNFPHQSITHRERLGGYLHPRDMRRLVTPFSATNEPELIVRRHVMLLNMDPLRAIVLRDRLLVLVPNGADSILEQLEKRVSGGLKEMENSVFDDETERLSETKPLSGGSTPSAAQKQDDESLAPIHQNHDAKDKKGSKASSVVETESESEDDAQDEEDDEWLDMNKRDWIDLPFELQSVDAVLHVVCTMLFEEANELQEVALDSMDALLNGNSRPPSSGDEHNHDVLRRLKNDMSQMSSRVLGFIRALNLVLDDDEDLALMNLSRLVTHPERFILPVSNEVLHEESDEPELILEGYLQQALSTTNALDSVKSQLNTTEELMNMKLDAVRNRLLYINTVTAFVTLIVTIGSFIGSIYGMNLYNGLEDSPNTWNQVVFGTLGGGALLFFLLMYSFVKAASVPSFH